MPHIIAETRQSRKWFIPCDNPFIIGLSLEVVEGSDLFPLELHYSLLTKTAQYFISLLESNAELEGHVHNAVWQGGTIWALDDVEILAEILENGRCIVVIGRSNLYCSLKCTNIVSCIVNAFLILKQQCCNQVFSKAYVVNSDTLERDIPLATNVSKVEASHVLYSISSDQEYVVDSSGAKIGRQKVNWLQRFTLKGKPLLQTHFYVLKHA